MSASQPKPTQTHWFSRNTNASHTKNIDTRRAIIHAVDKARFIKEEFAGLEQPVTQLLPFNTPFCS